MTSERVVPWWQSEILDPSLDGSYHAGRVWHHHDKWEDAAAGMYKTVTGKERRFLLDNAIDFTGDHVLYGKYMVKVVDMWPVSCEHNLSTKAINRRAWIGHAACCLAIGIPEDITREAWGHLSSLQRKLANLQADSAIDEWEQRRLENAQNSTWNKRFRGCKRTNINNIRPVQQNLFEFLRRQGFDCNASPGCR